MGRGTGDDYVTTDSTPTIYEDSFYDIYGYTTVGSSSARPGQVSSSKKYLAEKQFEPDYQGVSTTGWTGRQHGR